MQLKFPKSEPELSSATIRVELNRPASIYVALTAETHGSEAKGVVGEQRRVSYQGPRENFHFTPKGFRDHRVVAGVRSVGSNKQVFPQSESALLWGNLDEPEVVTWLENTASDNSKCWYVYQRNRNEAVVDFLRRLFANKLETPATFSVAERLLPEFSCIFRGTEATNRSFLAQVVGQFQPVWNDLLGWQIFQTASSPVRFVFASTPAVTVSDDWVLFSGDMPYLSGRFWSTDRHILLHREYPNGDANSPDFAKIVSGDVDEDVLGNLVLLPGGVTFMKHRYICLACEYTRQDNGGLSAKAYLSEPDSVSFSYPRSLFPTTITGEVASWDKDQHLSLKPQGNWTIGGDGEIASTSAKLNALVKTPFGPRDGFSGIYVKYNTDPVFVEMPFLSVPIVSGFQQTKVEAFEKDDLTINARRTNVLGEDASLSVYPKQVAMASDEVAINGSKKVAVSGSKELSLSGGDVAVTGETVKSTAQSSHETSGTTITSAATTKHQLSGVPIKVN